MTRAGGTAWRVEFIMIQTSTVHEESECGMPDTHRSATTRHRSHPSLELGMFNSHIITCARRETNNVAQDPVIVNRVRRRDALSREMDAIIESPQNRAIRNVREAEPRDSGCQTTSKAHIALTDSSKVRPGANDAGNQMPAVWA
ncbi:hypothetical protein BDW75DRAFT_221912 [Aspergillus navahoensis]